MTISLLQLNIESARFVDEIVSYIKQYDFDILHLQEVSAHVFNKYHNIDCFQELKNRLGYEGVLTKTTTRLNDPSSYFGKAILFKPAFTLRSQQEIWMKPTKQLVQLPKTAEEIRQLSHNALHVQLEKDGKTINCINTHLAWGPTPEDEQYKLDEAKILVDYMKNVSKPFVLSGDFNVTPDSQIVEWFDAMATYLITEYRITNTLNPNVHRAKILFPQGLAVDYIYISKDIKVDNFEVITEDLSDHFGLKTKIEI